MKNIYFLFALLLSFPIYAFANIAGTYEVKGFDPITNSEYKGTLVIQKVNDDIFNAQWTFTTGPFAADVGTGVKKGQYLSFVFNEIGTSNVGTQLYKIERHNVLRGPWVALGATEEGFERAKKVSE